MRTHYYQQLRKGEKLMTTKFAEMRRIDEFDFIGVIERGNQSFISKVENVQHRRHAVNELTKRAKQMNGKLNVASVHVVK